jgi:hypothetical protein
MPDVYTTLLGKHLLIMLPNYTRYRASDSELLLHLVGMLEVLPAYVV